MNKVRETVVSIGAPVDKNVIWIDISGTEPIQKIFLNGEWKPLKDSDVDARFKGINAPYVSDLSVFGYNTSPAAASALITKNAVDQSLTNKVDKATNERLRPEAVEIQGETYYKVTVPPDQININYTVDETEYYADIIDLTNISLGSDYVTTIRFTSTGYPIALAYSNSLKWANEEYPVCESGKEYIIAIWNSIGVWSKIDTIEIPS